MKIEPLLDRVLVHRKDPDSVTKSGLIVPDNAKEKPMECTVVATGPGKSDSMGRIRPTGVEEGESVLIGKFAGSEIEVDGVPLLLVRAEEILARVVREPEAPAHEHGTDDEA